MSDLLKDGRAELDYTSQLLNFENALVGQLEKFGLPTNGVLVGTEERGVVFLNAPPVVNLLEESKRRESIYIAKFLAAVASGLFDAALNYLWNETIVELRKRVEQYDIQYFFAVAVESNKKREGLKEASDLDKISDAELIKGARDIELISELGYQLLDNIKYMRNWASSAHPNQNEITGLQLITWLQTCIREVIKLPLSNIASNISQLLANIKRNSFTREEVFTMSQFLDNAKTDQLDSLMQGLYGIYLDPETSTQATQNINILAPLVWQRVNEDVKRKLGVRLATSIASGNNEQGRKGRSFFEVVGGIQHLPEQMLVGEINEALYNLKNAHRNMNNFYNEPAFALALKKIVNDGRNIPRIIEKEYVDTIVEVFLTNGNGVVFAADPVYRQLLESFDERQALLALTSYNSESIASKLQFSRCREKFKELIAIMLPKLTRTAAVEFANFLDSGRIPLDKISQDVDVKRRYANLLILVN